jgi:hypothetical protein
MKITVIWDVALRILVQVHQNLQGPNCLHLQGERVRWAGKQSIFYFEHWSSHVPPKHWLTFTRLHSITPHKTVKFRVTTVIILNLTNYAYFSTDDIIETIFAPITVLPDNMYLAVALPRQLVTHRRAKACFLCPITITLTLLAVSFWYC